MPSSRRQRVSQALQEQRRRWAVVRFALLATTLMLSIGVLMIAAPLTQSRLLLQVAMYAPLVVGVYVVSEKSRFAVIWSTALVFAVLLGIFANAHDEPALLIVDIGIRCVLLGALMFWVAREMVREVRVSLDTILGGSGGQPLNVSLHATHPFQTVPAIFYFSFTAFTTMGFGDITPVTALARWVTITEGMLGQLYPAIFIARLVSLSLIDATSPPAGG